MSCCTRQTMDGVDVHQCDVQVEVTINDVNSFVSDIRLGGVVLG